MLIQLNDKSKSFLVTVFMAFHIVVIIFVLQGLFDQKKLPYHYFKIRALFSGSDHGFNRLGSEIDAFKAYLPQRGEIAFITDGVPGATAETVYYHNAENYLAPLLVTGDFSLSKAIVFCSTDTLANKRLSETGYQWQHKIYPGKGVAVKIQ